MLLILSTIPARAHLRTLEWSSRHPVEVDGGRPMTPRERATCSRRRNSPDVDFHSFRRRFKQALAENNVDLQESMRLSGASSADAHQRYLKNTAKVAIIPAGALPNFCIADAETPEPVNDTVRFCSGILVGETGVEPATAGV
jgi:hypothetical protein